MHAQKRKGNGDLTTKSDLNSFCVVLTVHTLTNNFTVTPKCVQVGRFCYLERAQQTPNPRIGLKIKAALPTPQPHVLASMPSHSPTLYASPHTQRSLAFAELWHLLCFN